MGFLHSNILTDKVLQRQMGISRKIAVDVSQYTFGIGNTMAWTTKECLCTFHVVSRAPQAKATARNVNSSDHQPIPSRPCTVPTLEPVVRYTHMQTTLFEIKVHPNSVNVLTFSPRRLLTPWFHGLSPLNWYLDRPTLATLRQLHSYSSAHSTSH